MRVTNLANKRSIIVRVNDRGPYHQDRLIDVSVRTAKLLGFYDQGTARVRVDYVGLASLEGSDDSRLEATLRRGTPAPGPAEVQVASSRSLLPRLFDPEPAPPDRPFELGQAAPPARLARRAPSSEFAAVDPRADRTGCRHAQFCGRQRAQAGGLRPAAVELRGALWAGGRHAGSGHADRAGVRPMRRRPNPSSGAVITGRGLY